MPYFVFVMLGYWDIGGGRNRGKEEKKERGEDMEGDIERECVCIPTCISVQAVFP